MRATSTPCLVASSFWSLTLTQPQPRSIKNNDSEANLADTYYKSRSTSAPASPESNGGMAHRCSNLSCAVAFVDIVKHNKSSTDLRLLDLLVHADDPGLHFHEIFAARLRKQRQQKQHPWPESPLPGSRAQPCGISSNGLRETQPTCREVPLPNRALLPGSGHTDQRHSRNSHSFKENSSRWPTTD